MTKRKKIIVFFSIAGFFALLFLFVSVSGVHATYVYKPMEPIPGFESSSSDFKGFIESLYKFGIWTIGICAMLMIVIGGFFYFASAGNTAKAATAKKIITDAVLGLVIALAAYLILYVINPDLVNINIDLSPLKQGATTTGGTGGTTANGGTGSCTSITTGPCSVSNLQSSFGANAEQASAICNKESGGSETIGSGTDKCQPGGETVSYGLFQINISANKVAGLDCPSAFSSMYTGTNKTCTVTNPTLYNQCVSAAQNPQNNIQAGVSIYNSAGGWSPWGANTTCGF